MITLDDIRNPKRQSGFNHVNSASAGPNGGGRGDYWRALYRARVPGVSADHRGPLRHSPEEAAQDYLAYVNGGAATPASRASLHFAGHAKAVRKTPSKAVQVALDILRDERAPVPAAGWIYLVGERHSVFAVKIGWTSKNPPEARLNDYQAGNPRTLVMLGTLPGTKADEAALHKRFQHLNILGEWFRPTDELLSEFGMTTRKMKNAWRCA